jgi:hypothetical protein
VNDTLNDYLLIEKWSDQMGGVFSLKDIESLFNEKNVLRLQRRISTLMRNRVLTRFKREFYLSKSYNLEILSQRIYPDSYLSLGTVLACHLLIGSIPAKTVYAIKTGRNRRFDSEIVSIVYCGVAPHLYLGYEYENAIRYASAEKALTEFCNYLHRICNRDTGWLASMLRKVVSIIQKTMNAGSHSIALPYASAEV